ncbi:MAG TPA: cytochrome c peroxidase [Dissulfurispiraceae bacterium]|nr:cytochrome c peroxidase [Dissulfurispiraceae bacterium]
MGKTFCRYVVLLSMKNPLVASLMVAVLSCCFAPIESWGQDIQQQAKQYFTPLPAVMESAQNPVTPEKAALGKLLFYEPRISIDGTVSCAKCHPMSLYAVDALRKSVGNTCRENPRNAPTLLNAAGQISAHWIGNRVSVEDQAKQALVGPPSYGMPNYASVETKLRRSTEYAALFKKAFPDDTDPVTADNFAKAIGAFERTLVTPSPFDDFLKGNQAAMSTAQKDGLKLFLATGCVACHTGTYLGGQSYQKFGVTDAYWKLTGGDKPDEGRFTVTKDEADKYRFKVPILRNVAKTSPYFHDGSVDSLQAAVVIMAKLQLGKALSEEQAASVVEFLSALTGKIPEHALSVPLLPSGL